MMEVLHSLILLWIGWSHCGPVIIQCIHKPTKIHLLQILHYYYYYYSTHLRFSFTLFLKKFFLLLLANFLYYFYPFDILVPSNGNAVKNSRGISNALLISDDGNAHSTGSGLDDQLGIVANLQAMLAFATDIMLSKEDRPRLITLDMMRQTVLVHRIGTASLVCICRKNRDPATYRDKIATAVLLLEKLFLLQVQNNERKIIIILIKYNNKIITIK